MSVSFSARFLAHGADIALPVAHVEDLNLNQGNAALLLGLLELDRGHHAKYGFIGQVPARDFAERVALAEVCDLVGARPGFEDVRWTEVGSSAAYLRAKLHELAELARAAIALTGDGGDGFVAWG